jgi:hypothetical protein
MTNKYSAALFLTMFLLSSLVFSTFIVSCATGDDRSDAESKVFEMRTYTTYEGKLDDLHKRFEDHTLRLFEKHGMENIGYWVPLEEDLANNTLVFILAHENMDAAERNWDNFRADPEWQKAYEESHADGEIVREAVSVFMNAVPYSRIR